MPAPDDLLQSAIADNIDWCDIVARAHGGDTAATADFWRTSRPAPPFYPNLITARRGAQADIDATLHDLRRRLAPGWGIKDSFADLDLAPLGFQSVIDAAWYGGTVAVAPTPPGWHRVATAAQLEAWEAAWNPGGQRRIFPNSLLAVPEVAFWCDSAGDDIAAGCVTHATDAALGLSNWFHRDGEAAALAAALGVAGAVAAGHPVVFWSAAAVPAPGLRLLGPLRVWVDRTAAQA